MTDEQTSPAQSDPDLDTLASALQVTEGIVAGVRPEQASLPTPCPDFQVAQLVDHLVGFATNFADRATGVTPPADPTTTVAGDDMQGAYHDAVVRLVAGYRAGASDDATPLGIALIEAISHGWDLAKATDQPTPYPESTTAAALAAGQGMLEPKYRGEGMPFGEEVKVSSSAPVLHQFVAFMGRDPEWSA
jgi:uncharacterized protein (TIGR03086 family)